MSYFQNGLDEDSYFEEDDDNDVKQQEILAACPFLSEDEKAVRMPAIVLSTNQNYGILQMRRLPQVVAANSSRTSVNEINNLSDQEVDLNRVLFCSVVFGGGGQNKLTPDN